VKRLPVGATLALIGGLVYVSLASAKAPVTVNVTLSDFKVEMSNVNLPAGAAITYVITNNGKLTHEMVLEKEGVVDEPLEINGAAQEAEDIEPGATRTVEWTIPEAGKYQLACHVEGHYEAGMKTAFTTTAAAAAPTAAPATNPAPATMPKTGESGSLMWVALGLLGLVGLLAIGGALALRRRKA
jgi:LPXTG-motif cell wall-anchored protein